MPQLGCQSLNRLNDRGICRHLHIVFGKIDSGFQMRDDIYEPFFDRADPFRNRTFQLPHRNLRLLLCLGLDEVTDGLGLNKIQFSVCNSAQREFTGLRHPRPGRIAAFGDTLQCERISVCTDFHDILSGVGMRRAK